jgi:hypothetical protein
MSNYKLVFDGTISDGYQVEDVKRNLAALLKANETQIELLFSKPEVIIKKNLDHESATKYQKAMQKAGTVCRVMEVAGNQAMIPEEKAAPMKTDSLTAEPLVMATSSTPSVERTTSPPAQPFSNEPVMDVGETTLPQDFHHSSSQSEEEVKESAEKKIGRGIGDIIAGVVLIAIGLFWGGSIFLGNADALDYFFDFLGIFWIGKGIYKMIS